jgi:Fic family protein
LVAEKTKIDKEENKILQDNDSTTTKIINENELINFIEQQPNKLIEIIDIQKHFNTTDQQINDLLNKLKQEGILAEIRSGRVMLL